MKYLKRFETEISEKDKIDKIEEYVMDLYLDYANDPGSKSIEDCPFVTELAILYQRDYIKDLYDDWASDYIYRFENFEDFKNLYTNMIKSAKEKLRKIVDDDPSLFKYCEDCDIYDTNKYNL